MNRKPAFYPTKEFTVDKNVTVTKDGQVQVQLDTVVPTASIRFYSQDEGLTKKSFESTASYSDTVI